MPWRPAGEWDAFPTLGYHAIDWIAANLCKPGAVVYEPYVVYREAEDFLLEHYRLDPLTGRRVNRRSVLSRPRGWAKSPLMAAVCAFEGCGDAVWDGWDADGQPVGKPWAKVRSVRIQIAATSDEQVDNTWGPLKQMLEMGPAVGNYPELEPMDALVTLPAGKIERRTSSARSIKGAPNVVLAVLDQTEEWKKQNGGLKLANTMRANAAKAGGVTIETPNAPIPGEESVAERSSKTYIAIREGRVRRPDLAYDHREADPDVDLADYDQLIAGLRHAYGDASGHPDGCTIHEPPCAPGHVDLEAIVSTIWDPDQDEQQSRSDFLGQITEAGDAWLSPLDWNACLDVEQRVGPDEPVVLGFDGSRGRTKGKADATALIGCRVRDGHLFTIRVWEQPEGPAGKDWLPDVLDVNAHVRQAFEDYRVVGFYADPSGWATQVAEWQSAYGRRLRVKATQAAPIALWPRGKDARVEEYVRRLRTAIVAREITHSGHPALTRHVTNARRRKTRTGYLLYKDYPQSPNKIDAAYAAVVAFKARTDALALGIGRARPTRSRGRGLILSS